jgi:hypothetical protein
MDKRCVVCGGAFTAPPSSKRITCSRACSSARKSDTHRGQSNTWSPTARARAAARGQTPNLRRGTPAAQESPIAGPFETNQEAKVWSLRSLATGERYDVRNLALWCREHEDLFWPDDWERAYAGLRQVQAWLMGHTRRKVSRWKDWTLDAPAEPPS